MKSYKNKLKSKKMPALKKVEIYVEMDESETEFPQKLRELQDQLVLDGYQVELIGTRPNRRRRP